MSDQFKVFIENDGEQKFLRIEENRIERDYDEVVTGFSRDDNGGNTSFWSKVDSGKTALYEDFDITSAKHGINIYGGGARDIYDYTFHDANPIAIKDGEALNRVYANAIRISPDEDLYDADGPITVQRAFADGQSRPLDFEGGYDNSNKDFISNNNRATDGDNPVELFVRDFTARNFSDAIFDNKGTVYIMNGTLSNAHRILRAWPETEIVIVNSDIDLGEGNHLLWLKDETPRIKYFNVRWNGEEHPDPDLIKIQTPPKGMSKEDILAKALVPLDHNILEDMHPFFKTLDVTYSVEVSVDGNPWQSVDLDPALFTADGIIGDPRIPLPDFGNGDYKVRVVATNPDGETTTTTTEYVISTSDTDYGDTPVTGGDDTPDPATGGDDTPDPATGGDDTPDPATGGDDTPDPATGGGDTPDPTPGGDDTPDPAPGSDDSAGGGNDPLVLEGTKKDDTLKGGEAADVIRGNDGRDTLEGAGGDDRLFGGDDRDTLSGGAGDDILKGEDGKDTLDGGLGDDTLIGGKSSDVLSGGAGDDILEGDDGNDTLDGGLGYDLLFGGERKDFLSGGAGDDELHGGTGSDKVFGDEGNDTLFGDRGNDTLNGGDGKDRLDGGTGADTLTGGSGADTFVFAKIDKKYSDVVTDFSADEGDLIDLSGLFSGVELTAQNLDDWVSVTEIGRDKVLISADPYGRGRAKEEIAKVSLEEPLDSYLDLFGF